MRVLLVNAPPHQIVERRYDTPEFPRLALASLAAPLRERGIAVACVDAKLERLSYQQVVERAAAFQPDLVGFTAFTNEVKSAALAAGLIRGAAPHAKLILGGVHLTAIPERTMREFPQFDFGCVGEGELTLLELALALRDGRDPGEVAGLIVRDGHHGTRRTTPRDLVVDLDTIPRPAWDLMPDARDYTVMSARGCPFACPFCQNPNGRALRRRSPREFVDELQWLVEDHGAEHFFFSDEIFCIDRERTEQILDLIRERGLERRATWFALTHVNFVDEPLFRRMKDAGCESIGFGIETGDTTTLRRLRKGISGYDPILAARAAALRAGVPIEGYFILGQPNETYDSALRTIDLAVRVNPEMPIFGIMTPYPGTDVAEMAERGEGGYRIRSHDWNDYNKQIGDALEFQGLTRRQLERLQLTGYASVYLKNGRYLDLLRFAWRYRREGLAFFRKLLWQKPSFLVHQPPVSALS